MSSEPVVPLNNAEKEEESPYVAPGLQHQPARAQRVMPDKTDRLLEREYPDSRPLGEIPGEPSPRLKGTAETVGSAVGRAINKARDLPRRVAEMKERFTVIRGKTQESAASTAEDFKETAKQKARQAQTRVQHYAHEYPLQFIGVVGATCVVLGMILRVWRSSRYD